MVFLLTRPTWCYSIFLLFTFFTTVILLCGAEVDEYDIECSSNFTCGNINVSCPFCGNNRQPSCGLKGYELNCQEEYGYPQLPFIHLDNKEYLVLRIDQKSLVMTIARRDLLENSCSESPHDTLFNTTIYYIEFVHATGVTNVTKFHGCIDPNPLEPEPNKFPCPYDANDHWSVGFFFGDSMSGRELQYYNSKCSGSIKVPVLQVTFENLTKKQNRLQQDVNVFDVKYSIDKNCSACGSSGGFCGKNISSSTFECHRGSNKGRIGVIIVAGIVIGGSIMIIILFFFIKRPQIFLERYSGHQDIEDFIKQHGTLAPKRYDYSEVKKITNSFRDKLGQGGYGAVYKGILRNGCSVAVKILNTSKGNGEEFINEVASISRTSHVNIVTLLGFCYEGKRRALIYEFMANGSLDKFINDGTIASPHAQLGWEKLYQIAIGIARGLEYLHCGCNTRILHFDIKPHNILLDEEFKPKISDFGLSKLCLKKESIVSMLIARGTIGYIAPEVFNRNFGGVSPKSDVYSFGMMVLEMIGATKKIKDEVDRSSQLYFPDWIYKRFELGQELEIYYNLTSRESEILRKMVLIGLWCIQVNPSERPSMSKVIEMLEGSVEALPIPPKPFFTSPPRAPEGSYSTSILLIEE